jgi:hypothetical protein
MRWEDFERTAAHVLGSVEQRETMLFERHTDSLVSCAPLSTEDRQDARFYLEAVRGLPTA